MDDQRQNPCDRTYEVAIYQILGTSGHCRVANFYGKDDTVYHAGEVRISETLSLKFQPLTSAEAIQNAVASLDAQETKLRLELEEKLRAIREQRASLLAITFQPDAVS